MSEVNLPGTRSATTLEAFGLPRVALVPCEVTSVRWLDHGPEHLMIVCGGIELRLEPDNSTLCKACFDWLVSCMKTARKI